MLLTKSEAEQLLRANHVPIGRVVRVDEDVITWLSRSSHRPMTAWLERDGGVVRVYVQSGLPAEPDGSRVYYGCNPIPRPELENQDQA